MHRGSGPEGARPTRVGHDADFFCTLINTGVQTQCPATHTQFQPATDPMPHCLVLRSHVYHTRFSGKARALPAYTTTAGADCRCIPASRSYRPLFCVLGKQNTTSKTTIINSAPAAEPITIATFGIDESSDVIGGGRGGTGGGLCFGGGVSGCGGDVGGGNAGGNVGGVAGPLDPVPTTGEEVTGTPSLVVTEDASGSWAETVACSSVAEASVPSTVTMTASTIVLPPESANSICAAEICRTSASRCLSVF